MKEAPGDYTKAHIYQWLHAASGNSSVSVMETEKAALENRIWFTYAGQSDYRHTGNSSRPSTISRVMDDGSDQIVSFTYNSRDLVTSATDASGRQTLFTYSADDIDLLSIKQQVSTNQETLATFTYNAQHLPLTNIDAAGRTNRFGYNANGQLTAVTNAKNETVTMQYDANGYLTNLIGSITNATTRFTYDSYGRGRTTSDSENYTLPFFYNF